ncbi:hypothetical protein VPH35_008208 [Triticum aestivum]|uniref:zinc finger MYM-type protein 1 isoform X1 n=1 Tax=Triticum aestivum TaxID=4565 RepID=UPI00084373BC|nr:zinc finger MYM-type protein 1-like isoform X1 [Triticum aestivum]
MKKSMDLKTLWDRASKKSKIASTSTTKPAPIGVESRSRNQGSPSPSDGLQVVPEDDESGDDESIASNAKQLQAEAEALYLSRLKTSVQCLRFILQQGLPVHGHLENEGNAGNFLELVDWLAESVEEVKRVGLKDAPRSSELLDQKAQEQLINACAEETTRLIIEDLGDGYFAVLVYESRDVEQQEQLALCLRYVGTKGMAVERFLGIVGVEDTTPLTIKTTIQNLLTAHSLSFSRVRGLGYDGACAMKGYHNALKKIIVDEFPSAYYVNCFAHQLQVNMVAVAKQNVHGGWFFYHLQYLMDFLVMCCEKIRMLGVAQAEYIIETFELEETEAEYGLDRESLGTPCDTPRGSRYENVMHVISLYPAIWEILCTTGDKHNGIKSLQAQQVSYAFETFEFVFIAHLLQTIFEYTDDLCSALQKRDQDIVNAINLVSMTKKRLQLLREDGEWESFLQKVTSFCVKHDIELVDMDGSYDPIGRSPKFYEKATNLHYYHVDMFLDVIDSQVRELDGMFDEVNMELLICMAAFNPADSFAAYEEEKQVKLAHFYPEDFSQSELLHLPFQLSNFVDDLRLDERFREVKTLAELSIKLVETRKDRVYNIVYRLLRLVLILPVATGSDERDLSSVNYVNNKAVNKLSEQCANDCLVTCLERETFEQVKDDAIISRFRAVNNR